MALRCRFDPTLTLAPMGSGPSLSPREREKWVRVITDVLVHANILALRGHCKHPGKMVTGIEAGLPRVIILADR